jgi:hypothetical protein
MENQNVDSQFDSQFSLLSLTLVYTSEHSSLLPGTYFHVALEQVAGDDEMLELIYHPLSNRNVATPPKNSTS